MDEPVLGYILIGWLSGALGSMVGLGGGIIMVPAITIVYGVDIKTAIGASLVSMIATSVMSSSVYAKSGLIHYKLGFVLITTTIVGSFIGSYIGVFIDGSVLMLLFASLMIVAASSMMYRLQRPVKLSVENKAGAVKTDRYGMTGSYVVDGRRQAFTVQRVPLNVALSTFAGCLSGLLGVGGGIIQVPIMNVIGGVPIKVSVGTSSFMIGFTGLAGALIYFVHDKISPFLTASMVIGIMGGAYVGSKLAVKIQSTIISWILIVALVITSLRMFSRAW